MPNAGPNTPGLGLIVHFVCIHVTLILNTRSAYGATREFDGSSACFNACVHECIHEIFLKEVVDEVNTKIAERKAARKAARSGLED